MWLYKRYFNFELLTSKIELGKFKPRAYFCFWNWVAKKKRKAVTFHKEKKRPYIRSFELMLPFPLINIPTNFCFLPILCFSLLIKPFTIFCIDQPQTCGLSSLFEIGWQKKNAACLWNKEKDELYSRFLFLFQSSTFLCLLAYIQIIWNFFVLILSGSIPDIKKFALINDCENIIVHREEFKHSEGLVNEFSALEK